MVSFSERNRAERNDPEGLRNPGGERRHGDRRSVPESDGQRATRSDRALPGIKTGRGRERAAERVQRETGADPKMQAGNDDSIVGASRKAGSHRRGAKGRVEDHASIEMKRGCAPERRSDAR